MLSVAAQGSASSQHRRASPVWGDGFVDDDPLGLGSPRDWASCTDDELILFHPRLVAAGAPLAPRLRTHLELCVGVRALRLASTDRSRPVPQLNSSFPDPVAAAPWMASWFTDGSAVVRAFKRIGLLGVAPAQLATERALLIYLDGVLASVQRQDVPKSCDTSNHLLAFGAGIHPAYLWPDAAISYARGVTAGWLGHLHRGRAALMPAVVAEYVLDCLDQGGSFDVRLAELVGGANNLRRLQRAATRRRDGENPIVRLAPGPFRPARTSAEAPPTLVQGVLT